MNVEIITIGDEILIGQIVDSNSAWMAQELNKDGFAVIQITSVSDKAYHIMEALDNSMKRADIVLMTGGLGPTKDDITKQTLCDYFGTRLVFSEKVFTHLETIIAGYNGNMNELNRSQAYVPEHSTVINNKVGTAPITWFQRNDKVVVSMPGVPYEMMWAMSEEIIPRLKATFKTNVLVHRHFLVHGYGESNLAIKLEKWENELPSYIRLAYLPSIGLVKLRMSAEQQDETALQKVMEAEADKLHAILGNAILADEDIAVEVLIGNLLKEKGLTLATAESCTGGNIARMITSVAGSSDYFKGSVVAYDNQVKENVLGVSSTDILQYGAVSLPVVEQMAKGALAVLGADVAVATSGIAGPDGGTDEKPVGTVCIAVAMNDMLISQQFVFGKSRASNITRSSLAALVMVKDLINNLPIK